MTHPIQANPYHVNGTGGARAVFGNLQQTADAVPINITQGSSAPCSCACCEPDAVTYYGQARQNAPAGAKLLLTRYSPAGETGQAVALPKGRYLVSYSVNASAVNPSCAIHDPACTATLGVAPWLNGEDFSRGGSFATIRAEGSAALGSTFVVALDGEENTIGLYNPGKEETNYQLLNMTISRLA